MDLELTGKVALVTGAARGIGRAIALRLAGEGAMVVVNDLHDNEVSQAVIQEVRSRGGSATLAAGDVSDPAAVEKIMRTAEDWHGGIDILVNNAGVVSRRAVLDVDTAEWDSVLRTNLGGCFHCSQAAGWSMRARGRGGRIVNISSIHGRVAKAGMGSYCTSKAAIEMLSKQMAVELAPDRIGVNVVACGAIRTEINLPLYQSREPADLALQKALARRIPAGHVGEPEDIASAVAFLSSAAMARYITGAVLYVDGGYVADGTARL